MGYAGGSTSDPTYHDLGDYSETVQLDFDPSTVSYEDLLQVFFANHDASYCGSSRQYMSVIFYHTPEQERLAQEAKSAEEARLGKQVVTEILPIGTFYQAEDYHQKYALQSEPLLMQDFRAVYPDFQDIVDSTAATRVNAYLYGEGSLERLQRELGSLGLSAEGEERLLSVYR